EAMRQAEQKAQKDAGLTPGQAKLINELIVQLNAQQAMSKQVATQKEILQKLLLTMPGPQGEALKEQIKGTDETLEALRTHRELRSRYGDAAIDAANQREAELRSLWSQHQKALQAAVSGEK